MTKGRHVPPAGPPTIDRAANLRERLGRVAYEAQPNVPNDVWHLKPEHEREAWRAVGQAVMEAIVKPGQRMGQISVASTYGAATQQPYVELTCDTSPAQFSPAKAREIALLLLEAADAAESDALIAAFGRETLGLDMVESAQLLNQFRLTRERRRGGKVDTA